MQFTCHFICLLSEIIYSDSNLCGCVPDVTSGPQKNACTVTIVYVFVLKRLFAHELKPIEFLSNLSQSIQFQTTINISKTASVVYSYYDYYYCCS